MFPVPRLPLYDGYESYADIYRHDYQLLPMKHKQGFTMVELLLYMGILSIFLVVLTEIFLSTLNVELFSQATSATSLDGRFILARLAYDVGRARAITIPASPGGQVDNALQMTIAGVTYTYSVVNGNLLLANDSGTNTINSYTTTIPQFRVTKLGTAQGKQSVQILFTITSTIQLEGVPETRTFQTTIGLR